MNRTISVLLTCHNRKNKTIACLSSLFTQALSEIDLKVFKRLLNIFTMNDKHKCFKSHIETSIQYKILGFLVKNYIDEPSKISYDINNILTEDLNKIWNLG